MEYVEENIRMKKRNIRMERKKRENAKIEKTISKVGTKANRTG